MIKRINHQNFLTTPFVAVKSWEFFNVQNDDALVLEPLSASVSTAETNLSLDYLDYFGASPILNRDCNIALEQQDADQVIYQEGMTGSGAFYPDLEEQNSDGTFKRLVYSQIDRAFYNTYRNPTKIFGMEYIDFPLGRTDRNLAEHFRVFNIPRSVFGEKIEEKSVQFFDTALDDNVAIYDDGYQNLIAGINLFSKIQEVRNFGNIIYTGSATYVCYATASSIVSVVGNDSSSFGIGLFNGSVVKNPQTDASSFGIGLLSGYTIFTIISSSIADSGSVDSSFYSGSAIFVIVSSSFSDSGSVESSFYTGSLVETILAQSASFTASFDIGLRSGSLNTIMIPRMGDEDFSTNIGLRTGSCAA